MSKYSHVVDDRLRTILDQGSQDPADLDYAIQETAEAVSGDEDDEDVSYETFNQRQDALETAEAAWHDDSDAAATVAALQRCWSV